MTAWASRCALLLLCAASQAYAVVPAAAPAAAPAVAPAPTPPAATSAAATAADEQAPAPLELIVLGSGGPGATGRAGSSYLVLVDGEPRILGDAGPGSFVRLGETHLKLSKLDLVLLTHLHVDHADELPGIVKARAVSGGGPATFNVFGPGAASARAGVPGFPSTTQFVNLLFGPQGAFRYLTDFAAPVTFHVTNLPRPAAGKHAPAVVFEEDDLRIEAVAGHHGDAPAVIYRIRHAGRSITFSGDIDAAGLSALRRIAQGSDMLVFSMVVLDPPGSREILYTLHTPPGAIAALARDAGVHRLVLSHLSPAVEREREAVSASIAASYRGEVVYATDGLRLTP